MGTRRESWRRGRRATKLDILLPRSDAAVLLQVAVVTPIWVLVLNLVHRNRDLLLFVVGLGLLGAGLAAFRAVH